MTKIIADPTKPFPYIGKLFAEFTRDERDAWNDWKRRGNLARLLPLWPSQITIDSIEKHRDLIVFLEQALASERERGVAGHWAYDLARHSAIMAIYHAECEAYTRDLIRATSDTLAQRAASIAKKIADKITDGMPRDDDGEVVA